MIVRGVGAAGIAVAIFLGGVGPYGGLTTHDVIVDIYLILLVFKSGMLLHLIMCE